MPNGKKNVRGIVSCNVEAPRAQVKVGTVPTLVSQALKRRCLAVVTKHVLVKRGSGRRPRQLSRVAVARFMSARSDAAGAHGDLANWTLPEPFLRTLAARHGRQRAMHRYLNDHHDSFNGQRPNNAFSVFAKRERCGWRQRKRRGRRPHRCGRAAKARYLARGQKKTNVSCATCRCVGRSRDRRGTWLARGCCGE